ncbi:hypothetical protein BCR44DRAFT_1439566, partial [Catenaria anguillulae PL171]
MKSLYECMSSCNSNSCIQSRTMSTRASALALPPGRPPRRATRSAWLVALVLGTSTTAALAWFIQTHMLPRIRAYLAAVADLRVTQAQAHAALARLAANQQKYLLQAAGLSAKQLATARALESKANALVHSPPDETTPTQATANYPTPPPPTPRPDPAAFLAGYTADWLAQVLVNSSSTSKSPLASSSFGSAVARWNPTGHPMANILGFDLAAGLREAVEKCRSEVRLVRSAALSPRRVSSMGGIRQVVGVGIGGGSGVAGWRNEVGSKHVGVGRPSVLGVFGSSKVGGSDVDARDEEGRKVKVVEGAAPSDGSISLD